MKIMHITDLHIFNMSFDNMSFKRIFILLHHCIFRYRKYLGTQVFPSIIQLAKTTSPDVMIISGDITASGSILELQTVCEYLIKPIQSFNIQVIIVPGNHDCFSKDTSINFHKTFLDICKFKKIYDWIFQQHRIVVYCVGNFFFICLDTTITSTFFHIHTGSLSPQLQIKIKSILEYIKKTQSNAIIVIINHFDLSANSLENYSVLLDLLKKCHFPTIYLCGHTHSEKISTFTGYNLYSICGGAVVDNNSPHVYMYDITNHQLYINKYNLDLPTSEWNLTKHQYFSLTQPLDINTNQKRLSHTKTTSKFNLKHIEEN